MATCTWRTYAPRSTPRSPELSRPSCRMRRSPQPDAQRAATEVLRNSGQPPGALPAGRPRRRADRRPRRRDRRPGDGAAGRGRGGGRRRAGHHHPRPERRPAGRPSLPAGRRPARAAGGPGADPGRPGTGARPARGGAAVIPVLATVAEAWSEVRVHKARVVLSLVGVFLAVFAMTTVTALGLLVAQVQQEQGERMGGRAATIAVTAYDPQTGMPPATQEWDAAVADLTERYGITATASIGHEETRFRLPGGTQAVQTRRV